MSDFKAKMHQIRFWLGLRPRPPICSVGAYSTPPDSLAEVKGTTSLGRKGNGRKGRREGRGKGRRGKERRAVADPGGPEACPPLLAAWQLKY